MQTSALLLLALCGLTLAFDPSFYTNTTILRENVYQIHWKIVGDEIYLALEVATTGWVGFGLAESTSGSMPGADMITGHVTDGIVSIQDRHALAKEEPILDDCQSWELVGGEETNGKTIIEVKRKLDTGDNQDRPITEGRVRIVWSYSLTDIFGYHGEFNREASTVVFFGQAPDNQIPNTPDVQILDLINDDYLIPPEDTTYQHRVYTLPAFEQDVHIIAIEPIVDADTRAFVHHFLVYGCFDENGTYCATTWAWAPGIESFIAPPEAGFKAGPSPDSYHTIMIEIHFSNLGHATGQLDSSGVRLHYTTQLRQHDLDIIQLGDSIITQPNDIPAGQGTIGFEYNCPEECTSKWPHTLNVFYDLLHMHKAGSVMYSTQWRNGEIIRETNRVEFYDFDFQHMSPVSFTVEPGDRFNTHCVYHKNASSPIPFGLSTAEEMCIEFLVYWPKLPNPPGPAGCGFFFDPNFGRNFTVCDNDYLQVGGEYPYNPTLVDPVGRDEIRFGLANPDTYQCVNVVTTMSQASTSTEEESNQASELVPRLFTFLFFFLFALMFI